MAAESIPSETSGFRFIVIADSHIRPPDQEIDAYPSNALMVQRNEYVVELCNRVDAAFVVHLGDIVHPLPVEDTHSEAIDLAHGVYEKSRHAMHFVPGNHDVGDKPNAFVAVPAVADDNYPVYEEAWGPSFYSFDVEACHFVVVDAQLLNSGLEREGRQRDWLESDLDAASSSGRRIFMFTHYPPFVRDRHENEHYDNLGEPARTWLLDLVERHGVEALFSGHVHTFLYNRHRDTDLYVAPSTGFVRPDYSEVAAVPPVAENGRDDPPKLGIFIVDVAEDGHAVRPLRSYGSVGTEPALPMSLEAAVDGTWENPIGVTMRHPWMAITEFPTAGLDEFSRKTIRNDAPLLALWEARIRSVRIPLADLSTPSGAKRVRDLTQRGMRFTLFSAGVPDTRTIGLVRDVADVIERWEIIVPPGQAGAAIAAMSDVHLPGVRRAIAPITPIGGPDVTVHHFVSPGFSTHGDERLDEMLRLDEARIFDDVVFRVPFPLDVGDATRAASAIATDSARHAVVIVELPRGSESSVFDDDDAVALRVEEAVRASLADLQVTVFLDGFIDHDRGYYPRHGLIDRSFNPRRALYRAIDVARESTVHS